MGLTLSPKIKYIVTPAVGFGLAGLIWGWEAYRGTVGAGETFTNPFSYILGAIAFGILGSLSLVLFSGDKKKIVKVVLFGTIGWIVSFLISLYFAYYFWVVGGIVTIVPELFIDIELIDKFLSLPPSLEIGYLWIQFGLVGLIVGSIYSLLFKIRFKEYFIYTAGGFLVGAFFGPIIGNLFGQVTGSVFISYFVTFGLIGLLLGLLLGRVVNHQNKN